MTKLKKTASDQRAEINELRQMVTQLTLASAVLTVATGTVRPPEPTSDNVVPLRPQAP